MLPPNPQERMWRMAAAYQTVHEAARFDHRLLKPTKTRIAVCLEYVGKVGGSLAGCIQIELLCLCLCCMFSVSMSGQVEPSALTQPPAQAE